MPKLPRRRLQIDPTSTPEQTGPHYSKDEDKCGKQPTVSLKSFARWYYTSLGQAKQFVYVTNDSDKRKLLRTRQQSQM